MKQLLVLFFMLITANAFAQDSTANKSRAQQMADMQYKQLTERITDLSAMQQQQLKPIFDEYGKDLTEIKNKEGREKLEYFQTVNSSRDKKASKILNKEQQKIYEALAEEWREQMLQRRPGRN
jgi:hypothetical protein